MSQEYEPDSPVFEPVYINNIFVTPEEDSNFKQSISTSVEDENAIMCAARSAGRGLLRGAESAVLVAEVSPLNEAMRVAAGGAAIKAGISPEGVAAVYGGSTLVIESVAALVAARWLSSDRSKKSVVWFNEKLEDRGISPDAKFNKFTKAGIVFFGGSAISQTVEVREEPEMEKPEIRNYGLKVAALLAGACAVQGYFIGQGFETPSPGSIGVATIAAGSLVGFGGWIKRRVSSEQARQGIDTKALRTEAKEHRKIVKRERKQEKINRRNTK